MDARILWNRPPELRPLVSPREEGPPPCRAQRPSSPLLPPPSLCRLVLERLGSSLHVLNGSNDGARLFQRLALGMLSALQGLHAEGYIHRDVKLEV